jgi:hypothetical protein
MTRSFSDHSRAVRMLRDAEAAVRFSQTLNHLNNLHRIFRATHIMIPASRVCRRAVPTAGSGPG